MVDGVLAFLFAVDWRPSATEGFFFATFFSVSASQELFLFVAAVRLDCHSAEPSSPAIWSSERLVRTDQSSLSMLKAGLADSSFFLMRSHSLPLLPGRRARMWARTNSPFSFSPF